MRSQYLINKIIYAVQFLLVMMIEITRNFRSGFAIAIILITFLTTAAIVMPNIAYSQSPSSIPNTSSSNTANNKSSNLKF